MKILYLILCVLFSMHCFAFDDDYDGDGLVGEKDRFPILAEVPEVTWEIKKLIFTWDVKTELILENKSDSKKSHLVQRKFSFSGGKKENLQVDGQAVLTFNPFLLFGTYVRVKAGLHFTGNSDWAQNDQSQMQKCLEALAYQKTHIKNPHWEITVWIKNRTRRTLIAEDLEVPLLDAEGNVITYAVPYTYSRKSTIKIPARRNVPIKFRAEINTAEAFDKISAIKKTLPRFALANSMGVLNWKNSDEDELDIISKIQLMEEKTSPIVFDYKGYQVVWRVAKFSNGAPTTIAQALEQIHNKVLQFSKKPFYVKKETKLVEIAGFANANEYEWKILNNDSTIENLQHPIGEKVLFQYTKTGTVRIEVEDTLTRLLKSITDDYLKHKNELSLERATNAYVEHQDVRFKFLRARILIRGIKTIQSKRQAKKMITPSDLKQLKQYNDHVSLWLVAFAYEEGLACKENKTIAFEYNKKAANLGNISAMTNIGSSYYFGDNVTQNSQRALKWFKKATDSGSAHGMFYMGVLYEDGKAVHKSIPNAIKWYKKASDQNNSDAMIRLGLLYAEGKSIPKNMELAIELFRKAANLGNSRAMVTLGYTLIQEQRDYHKALQWYEKAATLENPYALLHIGIIYLEPKRGEEYHRKAVVFLKKIQPGHEEYAEAIYYLGTAYEFGVGVKKDYEKAVELYFKSERLGNKKATHKIGVVYYSTKEYAKALEFFNKAAKLEESASMYSLGYLYENGEGVQKNVNKAISWYEKAAKLGNSESMFRLGLIYFNNETVTKDYQQAFHWWKLGAKHGHGYCTRNLGLCYQYGWGVEKNYNSAIDWYQKSVTITEDKQTYITLGELYYSRKKQKSFLNYSKAANLKDGYAMRVVGLMYQDGFGTEQDYSEAISWFQKASKNGDKWSARRVKGCNSCGSSPSYVCQYCGYSICSSHNYSGYKCKSCYEDNAMKGYNDIIKFFGKEK